MPTPITITWKFLKEQDWKYAIPSLVFFCCFTWPPIHSTVWHFIFATGFLVCYSLKFAGKHDNLLIDQLKIVAYFLYFTTYILFLDSFHLDEVIYAFFSILFCLYFYTCLNYYISEMEAKGKSIRKSFLYLAMVFMTIFSLGTIIWGITQKVEAEKQKVLAMEARVQAEKAKHEAEEERSKTVRARLEFTEEKEKAMKYQAQYEALLKKQK